MDEGRIIPAGGCGRARDAGRSWQPGRPAPLVTVLLGALILAVGAPPSAAAAQPPPAADPSGAAAETGVRDEADDADEVMDSAFLYRLASAVAVPDGLLRVELGRQAWGTTYEIDGGREKVDGQDLFLALEYGLRPRLNLRAELPLRSWSRAGGSALAGLPATGSGLGDGRLDLVAGLPGGGGAFAWALRAGAVLPTGDEAGGLSEGATSFAAGLAASLRLWTDSRLPEMRIHLGLGRRWNRNEERGYGDGIADGLQPWFPRYPRRSEGGAADENDFLLWGAAVEFRAAMASLFVEYSEARLDGAPSVAAAEFQRQVTAGMRWGRSEGWALSLAYDVSLAMEDRNTDFTAAYPDLVFCAALSRQFSLGGRDRDGDGVPDRRDRCPRLPEDLDGFRDDDGCPDPDNDGDGVPDVLDEAPFAQEDRDGFQDEDGVPDLDNDGDQIPDVDDVCPDEPEDYDGELDDDGCPDEFSDRDRDGVEDRQDRCPDLPEDRDGFEDDDGCPDTDNDLDGIEDARDGCPDEPETYNGIDDDDGCPD